jgi:ABC-2 type transport system permease protein
MQILTIAWRTLRSLCADKKNLVIMLLMPLAFSLVFGLLLGGGKTVGTTVYPVALFAPEPSGPSASLRQTLLDHPHILLTEVSDEAAARQLVQSNEAAAAVLLPSDFNQQVRELTAAPAVKLVRSAESNLSMALEQDLQQVFSHLTSAAIAANLIAGNDAEWQQVFDSTMAEWQQPPVAVQVRDAVEKKVEVAPTSAIGLGFVIMFVMMGQSMAAGSILEEKGIGTWQRIIAAPVTRGRVLLGYILAYFLCGWIQFLVLLLMERWLFGVSLGADPAFVLLTSLLVLCSVAAGMTIAGVVKTYQQQQAVTAIAMNVTSMLGGLFFPVEMFNPAMVKLAMLTPQYWARRGYVELILRGGDWQALQPPLLVLAGFSLLFFVLSLRGVRTTE